jgi:ABC-type sulfate/molybdate transport systems ATPase subunit
VWGQEPWTLSQQDIVSLRRRIGFVPDRGELIKNLSLFDNLVLPLRYHTQPPEQEVRQRANELLALMEIARLPQVPTSRADRRLAQKIALARALILEPELLLLDQPTHDFDVDFADYVWRLLDDVCGKRNVAVLAMVRDQQEGRSLTDNHLSLAAEWAGNMWCAAAPAHD